jgi:hypothetical protein
MNTDMTANAIDMPFMVRLLSRRAPSAQEHRRQLA